LIGKKILVVGQGKLVGEPLALILANKGYQVRTADSSTADLASLCKQSDVVISAVGKSNLINASMIKTGTVVIDAGISEVGGKMTGDIDYDGMEGIASAIAKVPGGVGPVTVSCLLHNVAIATKNPQ
jgi:methylenetetrahydrofolate dehydrogenase (NADP+)/methenyltetrahydrofolate cyclohydrolase